MSQNPAPNASAKSVLSNPNFRNLWLGQTISQIGDGLTNLALLIVINELTGSTAAVATMTIAIALPQLLFGLLAGVFVDRWDRKRILLVSDALRGVLVLGLIFVRRPDDVWVFYVLGFLQAAIGTFFDPAKSALIPDLVGRESLLAANGLSQTTRVLTGVVGSALAGVLVGATGQGWPAFALDAVSFIVSAFFIFRIVVPAHQPRPQAAGSGAGQVLAELVEGLRFIFSQRTLTGVTLTFAVTMLGLGAVNVLFVPFLINILKVPTAALGVVEVAQVVGMIVGSGLAATLATRLKPAQMIVGGVTLLGVLIAGVGASSELWLVLLGLLGVGLVLTPVQAAASTLMQSLVPTEKRGRAMSVINTVITLASVISMGASGVLGDMLGVRQVFYLAGGIAVLSGLVAAFLLREIKPLPQPISESSALASVVAE
jgi:MFS family permease